MNNEDANLFLSFYSSFVAILSLLCGFIFVLLSTALLQSILTFGVRILTVILGISLIAFLHSLQTAQASIKLILHEREEIKKFMTMKKESLHVHYGMIVGILCMYCSVISLFLYRELLLEAGIFGVLSVVSLVMYFQKSGNSNAILKPSPDC